MASRPPQTSSWAPVAVPRLRDEKVTSLGLVLLGCNSELPPGG
jgi:hypothetical protein